MIKKVLHKVDTNTKQFGIDESNDSHHSCANPVGDSLEIGFIFKFRKKLAPHVSNCSVGFVVSIATKLFYFTKPFDLCIIFS